MGKQEEFVSDRQNGETDNQKSRAKRLPPLFARLFDSSGLCLDIPVR